MGHPVVHVLTTLCHLYVTVAISPNDRGAIILFLAIVLIFTTVLSFLGRLGLLGAFPSTGTITAFGTTIVLNILLWTLREVSDIWGPQAFGPAISWTSIGPFLGLLFVEDEVAIMFLWITLFSLFVRLEELEKTDEGRGNARTLFFISLILLLFQHETDMIRLGAVMLLFLAVVSSPLDQLTTTTGILLVWVALFLWYYPFIWKLSCPSGPLYYPCIGTGLALAVVLFLLFCGFVWGQAFPLDWVCSSCRAIAKRLVDGKSILLKDSYKQMKRSANRGCHSCRFFLEFIDQKKVANYKIFAKGIYGFGDQMFLTGLSIYSVQSEVLISFNLFVKENHDKAVSHVLRDLKTTSGNGSGRLPIYREAAEDAGHSKCLNYVANQLQNCRKNHKICPFPARFLGSRILRIGEHNRSVRLMTVDEEMEPVREYIALSHCWGNNQNRPIITTSLNISERQAGITFEALPKSFQDAVIVTLRLGFEYLWIDSLCIVQDSVEDWTQEAAKMWSIYTNATLTISASCATDSQKGFLTRRNPAGKTCDLPLENTAVSLRSLDEAPSKPLKIHWEQPLQKRAWTFQERLLSRRLVFFDPNHVLWECCTERSLEIFRHPLNSILPEQDLLRSFGKVQKIVEMQPSDNQDLPQEHSTSWLLRWHEILTEFLSRDLTYSKDALISMSGVAREFARVLKDNYLAGIWRGDLLPGLTWHTKRMQMQELLQLHEGWSYSKRDTESPSWSWAANFGRCCYSTACDSRHIRHPSIFDAELTDTQIVPAARSDVFGLIEKGALTLSGFCKNATLVLLTSANKSNVFDIHMEGRDKFSTDVYLDDPIATYDDMTSKAFASPIKGVEVFILARWDVVEQTLVVKEQLHALLLRPVYTTLHQSTNPLTLRPPSKNLTYQRCGLLIIDCSSYFLENFNPERENWTKKNVTII
jgi:Heterokaryon incompatibility protein (HET)